MIRPSRPLPCLAVGSLRSLSVSSCAFSAVCGSLLRPEAAPRPCRITRTHTSDLLSFFAVVFVWFANSGPTRGHGSIPPPHEWIIIRRVFFGKVRRDVAAPICEGHGAFFERYHAAAARPGRENVTVCRFSWSHWGGAGTALLLLKRDVIHHNNTCMCCTRRIDRQSAWCRCKSSGGRQPVECRGGYSIFSQLPGVCWVAIWFACFMRLIVTIHIFFMRGHTWVCKYARLLLFFLY